MAGQLQPLTEKELARRRALAESIDRRIEEIRQHIAKTGPPEETITQTLRRLRGGYGDGSP